MTSYTDHTVWQDVYHLPYQGTVIYVKFVADVVTEFRLLSFKEK
jgi:motility quorum-sensing regulator / GCU-specific mRNA interferase toxin